MDLNCGLGSCLPLSDVEFDTLYEELTLQVELVQLEQLALLCCLMRNHGLRRIHTEGLTKTRGAKKP